MNFWDQKYDMPDYKYGKLPNRFLQEQQVRLRPASTVLLPGDGEGRNSVWLAEQGHSVTAVDSSALGLDKTRRLAAEKGVVVTPNWPIWSNGHLNPAVLTPWCSPTSTCPPAGARRPCSAWRGGCTAAAGWFWKLSTPCSWTTTAAAPKMPACSTPCKRCGETWPAAGLQEALAWEGEVILAEGTGHQGPAYVTRYVAQRTAS